MPKSVKERVKELRQQGLTFSEIGKIIGKSRQRAQQIFSEQEVDNYFR